MIGRTIRGRLLVAGRRPNAPANVSVLFDFVGIEVAGGDVIAGRPAPGAPIAARPADTVEACYSVGAGGVVFHQIAKVGMA